MSCGGGAPNSAAKSASFCTSEQDATQLTCDVLCSLGASAPAPPTSSAATSTLTATRTTHTVAVTMATSSCTKGGKSASLSACPKQHQLPMFLSKTYHMIDRCEPTIATWSHDGSNFVVKNVEKFASSVLPLYFKHSNFSSFARQLNFYGFRKLRTDPILTSDVDPRTACYVRFYHEKFQKDRPELLHQIKRATKSDQQSKDDVESLKAEVCKLKETIGQMREDTDRRLVEMSYECNRRITSMGAEYDKLAAVVHQLVAARAPAAVQAAADIGLPAAPAVPSALRHNPHAAAIAAAAAVAAGVQPAPPSALPAPPTALPAPPSALTTTPTALPTPPTPLPAPVAQPGAAATTVPAAVAASASPHRMPDLMQSLSQAAAISLQQQQAAAAAAVVASASPVAATTTTTTTPAAPVTTLKRSAEGEAPGAPPNAVAREEQQPSTVHPQPQAPPTLLQQQVPLHHHQHQHQHQQPEAQAPK